MSLDHQGNKTWLTPDWLDSLLASIYRKLSALRVIDSSTWPPTLSLAIRSGVCLTTKTRKTWGQNILVLQWKTQHPPPLDSLLKSKWDKKIHMFQRVFWQILTPTFFSCWWKSILARVTLLLQPLSLKGTRFHLMPLPLFVKWLEFFS